MIDTRNFSASRHSNVEKMCVIAYHFPYTIDDGRDNVANLSKVAGSNAQKRANTATTA
jgi:hypothetical protein